MTNQQPDHGDGPPRLSPRPLERPPVDAEDAALFGRPDGVTGAFEPARTGAGALGETNGRRRVETAPPPHHALVSAFSFIAEFASNWKCQ